MEGIQKLKVYDMSTKEILSLLQSKQSLLKMTVCKNYRLYIDDRRVEVRMELI